MRQSQNKAKSPYKQAEKIGTEEQFKIERDNSLNCKPDSFIQSKAFLEVDKQKLSDKLPFSKTDIGNQQQQNREFQHNPKQPIRQPQKDIKKQNKIKKSNTKKKQIQQYLPKLNKEKKKPFDYNLLQNTGNVQKHKKSEDSINKFNEQNQDIKIDYQGTNIYNNEEKNTSKVEEIQANNIEISEPNNQDEQKNETYQLNRKFQSNKARLQKTVEIIRQLQKISSNQRHIEEKYKYYLRETDDFNSLCQHYSIKKLQQKQNLKKHCNNIQFVRGDGNCFYTAFGYQLLKHLLCTFNLNQYDQFIQFILDKKIQFKINYDNFQIDDQDLLEEFLYQLQQLRLIEDQDDRKQQLLSQFAEHEIQENGQGCFHNLSTIFLRNLCDNILEFSELKDLCLDRENLLIWEAECNSNEVIIQALASKLKINVKLIFFSAGDFIIQEYEKDFQNQIILLIQPGHYNIGYNK
ncbi:unnamed protein product [Paramecium octaurelia]|uniref:OTU domain-containing protein n=1 Tax=Paramecium octaurelia TaxID=43137 RepID=A0A8S1W8T0_PAROT|nr:unnamed protein product [Paramecium octaurelia]